LRFAYDGEGENDAGTFACGAGDAQAGLDAVSAGFDVVESMATVREADRVETFTIVLN
jgi:hypothetical protein